jgi:hypothetical protein
MANRRMFSKDITGSDAFLDMPSSTQALYFQLWMHADDDWFLWSAKMIVRMLWCWDDDMKILIVKRFVMVFENWICVIKHRWMNNKIRKDRYIKTVYTNEFKKLRMKENGSYAMPIREWQPNDNQMTTKWQPRIGKDRIGKDRIGKDRIGKDRIGKDRIGKDSKKGKKNPLSKEEDNFEEITLTKEVKEFMSRSIKNNAQANFQFKKKWNKYLQENQKQYNHLLNDLEKNWIGTPLPIAIAILECIRNHDFRKNQIQSISKLRKKNKEGVPYWIVMIEEIKKQQEDKIPIF